MNFTNMDKVTFTINGQEVITKKDTRILWAALDAGIYIPNICALRERVIPFGSCRLCLVEVEGREGLVASCSEPAVGGMKVFTDTPGVRKVVQTAFELLVADHHLDCKNCPKHRKCGLQEIAQKMRFKLKSRRFHPRDELKEVDDSHPSFIINPNKCVLCGKCVWVCNDKLGTGLLDFAGRGLDTRIVRVKGGLRGDCNECMECVNICPVGALVAKDTKP